MALIEGGDIGVDEGGILEALRDPLWTKTTVKYRHNKEGLVTSEETTVKQYTGAHALTALVLILGPAIFLKFNSAIFTNPDAMEVVKNAFAPDVSGPIDFLTPGTGDKSIDKIVRKFMDPFNFFD